MRYFCGFLRDTLIPRWRRVVFIGPDGELIEFRANESGILSLTTNKESFDMWNMYSNGHKGFLLEFYPNFNEQPSLRTIDKKEFYLIKPVKYVKENYVNINEVIKSHNLKSFDYIYNHLFYTKSNRWIEECEYRIVRPLSDLPYFKPAIRYPNRDEEVYLFDFSLDCIKSVAFGAHMSIENKKCIYEKCLSRGIQFFQEIIIKDEIDKKGIEGKINYLSVGESKQIPTSKFFDMMPQFFCVTKNEFTNYNEVKLIKNLSELPYYKDNEEVINNLYTLLQEKYKK